MELRSVGQSGLVVSALGLGCNNFGVRLDQQQATRVVDASLDAGITLFDTADVYGAGQSEPMLGKALGSRRHQAIIATKFGIIREHPMPRGGSRGHVLRSCEASLKKLGTDYIDLYIFHKPDPFTPIEETLGALNDLVHQGKVRYVASSNQAGWQMVDSDHKARSGGLQRFVAAQVEWSLLNRDIEREIVPAANHLGMSIIPYFPLASGLLTGKYKRNEAVPSDSRVAQWSAFSGLLTPDNFDRVERLAAFAEARGHSLLELAVSWVAGQRSVASVLFGATKPEQVAQNVAACGWRLSEAELAEVDSVLAASRQDR